MKAAQVVPVRLPPAVKSIKTRAWLSAALSQA
jgi:hypothetical protein